MEQTKNNKIQAISVITDERSFLSGPNSRWSEFKMTVRVAIEFIRGFRALHWVGPCVTVFGSARFKEDHVYYQMAVEISKRISKLGFTVMTGGGPGIMEAANRGARLAKGKSVGCNIVLPFEQSANPFLDIYVNIKYFFVRKVFLLKYSYAFVALPGGFGTLDELFEVLTLIQTRKIVDFPVVLMGKSYYEPLVAFIRTMVDAGTISAEDLDLFLVTDDTDEAIKFIEERTLKTKKFKLSRMRKFVFFGE